MNYEQEIKFRLEALWRDVDSLLKEAEESAGFCTKLLRGRSLPMMTTDLPTKAWMRIGEAVMAIAQLKQIEDEVKREKFWKTKKPRARCGTGGER